MIRFILSMTLLLLVFSCTVEKRLHQPGWHVEWKHRLPDGQENATAEKQAAPAPAKEIRTTEPESPALVAETTGDSLTTTENTESFIIADTAEPAIVPGNMEPEHEDSFLAKQVKRIINKPVRENEDPEEVLKKKTSPLVITMWILNFVLALTFTIIAIVALSSANSYIILITGFLFICVAPVFLITNFVMGAIAFKRKKENPDEYRDSRIGLAIFGGLLMMVVTLLAILALSLLSLLRLNW